MFDRAQSRLVLLKETEEVTARDILDVFRDLCSDVSQEGKKVEKLPPGDEEELVSDLCFTARMISRIYTENETLFSNGQHKSHQDLKEETEAKEKQYEKLFAEMKAKETALLEKQRQLEKDLEASAKEQELLQQKRKQELEQKEKSLREKIRQKKE